MENEFWQPPVATAQEAAEDEPDYEFVDNSNDQSDSQDNFEEDEEVEFNLEDEVSSGENHTPVFGTHNMKTRQNLKKKRRHTLFEDSDDESTAPKPKQHFSA